MSSQPVEANVVLTADNSAYDQSMVQSAGATTDLGKSIDSLGQKINQLSKIAGKTLIGISAADVAVITGATAAWASYEKQVARLQSQAEVLTRTEDRQTKVMKDYATAVKGLRTEYGTTTAEAAKLVETLTKMTNLRQSRDLKDLSKVFVDMSHATGESSEGLASSLLNLQKVMGTRIDSKTTRNYADQFTYLAARTNTSAQSLIEFTTQLAPIGRSIGMSQNAVTGFATAFARAGQDGQGAATVFNKVTSDIAQSMATGSPELQHYANMLGVTSKQLSKMDKGEALAEVMEYLSSQGPKAIVELQRLGLEGPRTLRSITAVINEQGGVRQALGMAEAGSRSGAAKEGADATESLSRQMERLQETMKSTAETMGGYFAPVLEKFVTGLQFAAEISQKLAEGPMGDFLGMVMSIVAPLAAGGGALLLFAGTLLKVAAAFALVRNSMALGAREGFRGGAAITQTPEGTFAGAGGAALGKRGGQIAQGGTWFQRGLYNAGQPLGAGIAGGLGGIRGGYDAARSWHDPNYQPAAARSLGSYTAGGVGRAIDMILTPQFDQMRYQDPSKRTRSRMFSSQFFPGTRPPTLMEMASAGAVGQAEQRAQTAGAVLSSAQGANDPRALARAQAEMQRASADLVAANDQHTETVRQSTEAQRLNTGEVTKGTRGYTRLGRSLAGLSIGAGGAVVGGAASLWRSPMGVPAAGMLGMGAMSAMGVHSNMAMMAGMGAMMGPWGAAGGAGVGAIVDAASANDEATESIKNLNYQAKDAASSGQGLGALYDEADRTKTMVSELKKSFEITSSDYWFDPQAALGSVKNSIEGIFGSSDIEELEGEQSRAQKSIEGTEATVRTLARTMGASFGGTRDNQLAEMDKFVAGPGGARLGRIGMTYKDYEKAKAAQTTTEGAVRFAEINQQIAAPMPSDIEARVAKTAAGRVMQGSPAAQRAMSLQGDVQAFYEGAHDIVNTMLAGGKSYLDILHETRKTAAAIGDENERGYELQSNAAQLALKSLQLGAPGLTRTQALQQQIGVNAAVNVAPPPGVRLTQADVTLREQTQDQTVAAFGENMSYFKQLLLAQEQYELSRSRASQDFYQSQSYQQQDFAISRARAEENFNRMRLRASADFHRQERRSNYNYNLQRARAEEDFNHQVTIMAKQQAQSVYDIYKRVDTERTSSAEWVLSNASDQLDRMQDQVANLDKARQMGLSNSAIQQLGLTDPQNAQQLARMLTELTPQMIAEFNKVAGTEREKAAKELITDPASLEWREMRRGFHQSMDRMAEDYERQMKNSRKDFNRGMHQQKEDFNIMMEDQAEDFARQTARQEKAYKQSMDRAAEDMANMANEVNLSMEEVLVKSVEKLSGSAKKQAEEVLKSFRDLKKSTSPEAIAIMTELAAIFGFEYTAPKSTSNNKGPLTGHPGPGAGGQNHGHADGGVIPGWTPGRDTQHTRVSGGEAIMRPEWTRAVGEKAINAMNHQAKHGGFAEGGVYWPVPGHRVSTYPGHDGIDINRGSGWDDFGDPIRAFRSGTIAYAGSQHGYGNAIFENTAAGNVVYGHTSRMMVSGGQAVTAGQLIGLVGTSGNSTGPHLHFGVPGGTPAQALALLAGAIVGGGGGGDFGTPAGPVLDTARLRAVLKDRYPQSEAAAKGMKGAHPLFPGDISKVINRFAHDKIKELRKKFKSGGGEMSGSSDIGNQPGEHMSNQDIVHTGARRMGWAEQWAPLYELVMHESGFNNLAQNPNSSAYGMFQFLDGTWAGVGGHKTSDPWLQTQYGLKYIQNRYNDPKGAWDFWQDHNWYKDGAVFNGAQTIGVGENGPEAVIPLNARGGEFLADVMGSVMGGRNVVASGRGHTIYNTQVNRNTNFTGPITVQANNPMELLNKLQARQRVMALTRPGLTTGTAA